MRKNQKENSNHNPESEGSISRTGFLKSVGSGIAASAMAAVGLGAKSKDKKKI